MMLPILQRTEWETRKQENPRTSTLGRRWSKGGEFILMFWGKSIKGQKAHPWGENHRAPISPPLGITQKHREDKWLRVTVGQTFQMSQLPLNDVFVGRCQALRGQWRVWVGPEVTSDGDPGVRRRDSHRARGEGWAWQRSWGIPRP